MSGLSRSFRTLILAAMAASLCACSLVDEDRDHCDGSFQLRCRIRMVTRLDARLQEALGKDEDKPARELLAQYLQPVFVEKGKEARLAFYEPEAPGALVNQLTEAMDAQERVYPLVLPVAAYRNLTLVNLSACPALSLEGDDPYGAVSLRPEDPSLPQQAGVFSGRSAFEVKAGKNEEVAVSVYMVNAATALVLDASKAPSLPVRVTVDGMATGFGVADSSFVRRADAPEIRTDVLATADGLTRCYASVHFPSTPLSAKADAPAAWHWNVYVTLTDGTVTQSVLSMPAPLLAGELAILKGMVQDTGVVTTEDPDVGVSVTLDWHQGMEIPVDF